MPFNSKERTWIFSILFWLVGLSSWITVTSLFNELSLMIKDLPGEGFEIWSYITLIIQLANIGPLIYSLIPRNYKTQKFVIIVGYTIFIVSCLSMLGMSLFWDTQIKIFGKNRSLILYLTTFGTAICDCMTSIIFWVFVSYFPTQYMALLSAGESSSGIICAILIYIQQLNVNKDDDGNIIPRYSVEIYFLIIAMLLPISAMAFTLLIRFLKKGYFDNAKDWISDNDSNKLLEESRDSSSQFISMTQSLSKYNNSANDTMETEMVQSKLSQSNILNQYQSMKPSQPLIIEQQDKDDKDDINMIKSTITLNTNQMNIIKDNHHLHSSFKSNLMTGILSEASTGITQNINKIIIDNVSAGYYHWIVMIGILSGIQNGMLPAISSYSLLPYGDIAYVWTVTISNILQPISAIIPVLFPRILLNKRFIFLSSIGWIITAIYILNIATESPKPIGMRSNNTNSSKQFWKVTIIIVSISCIQLLTVCKTAIYLSIKQSFMLKANYLDQETLTKGLSKMMEIVGIAVQIGSFCGALTFFFLINFTQIFQQ